MPQTIPELLELERLALALGRHARVETLASVSGGGVRLPVQALGLGASRADAPVLICVGGVHGLERIGAQVVLGFIETLSACLSWDRALCHMLEHVRVLFLPVLNPIGVLLQRRSNGSGVDLMRNAPVSADVWESPFKLYRGQRLTSRLPWYRGRPDVLEPEAAALCDWVHRQASQSPFVLTLDVHSGFVGRDRIWFPYARTRRLFPHVSEMLALKGLIDQTYPRHRYLVEPQAAQYTTHGDLWDYIYDRHRAANAAGIYLPLTLELGASSWLRKGKRLLNKSAFFHPLAPHRTERVLRRHVPLFEFLLRAAHSWQHWARLSPERRASLARTGQSLWT
jgi:hypothetical protein